MEGSIMGQVRHGCATTTHAVRAAIQRSQATNAALSRELGINVKTVAKWHKRETIEDRKSGPTEPSSTVLSTDEEAMVVAFRRHTLLPLDDCPYALHRCLHDMAYPGCQIWRATNPSGKSSNAILLATSTSISRSLLNRTMFAGGSNS
jgi:transposase-like protein